MRPVVCFSDTNSYICVRIMELMAQTNYIKIHNGSVDAKLDVLIYEADGVTYAYAPALDLVGYGENTEQAKQSFSVVIGSYFEFGLKRGTLEEDLKRHNWVKKQTRAEFSLPKAWMLFNTSKQMQSIYSGKFIKDNIPVSYAAC